MIASFITAMGAAVAPAAFSSATALSVPFAYMHHEVLVDIRIGTTGPYTFMLDTDTTPSIIDLALARRLHLPTHGSRGAGIGIGSGKVEATPLTIPNVRVGAVRVARLDALALDLSGISAGLGRRVDGVLGTSFLDDRVVQIDYACRTVSFLPDAILAPFTARFRSGPQNGENVSSDVWVGSHGVLATFDTGDSGASFVTAKGIADLNLQAAARRGRPSVAHGFAGAAPETAGTLENVRIARTSLGTLKTRFLASDRADPFDVNIGNETLQRFVATFDYQRGLLTLTSPRANECKKP